MPNILFEAKFDARLMVEAIDELGVTNFAGAPTMYQAVRALADERETALRCASSAGSR